jgi:anionic cell wall polymer biosynthesis LytR-Cps2A-Psr (LCP) family protein
MQFNRKYGASARIVFLLFLLFVLVWSVVKGILIAHTFIQTTGISPSTIIKLAFDTGAELKTIEGRTNMVLLGVAGGEHDGADLTDTILVLSFKPEAQTLSMISLPRDLWSDTLKDKINSAYHYGEEKKKGGGLILSKAIISDMVGLPVEYGLVFDFSKFRDIINLVGGVSIDVPKEFTDKEFPIPGRENDTCNNDPTFACRYEALHFAAGMQMMDGDTALKYVRSRHAEGAEGSDFARSKRQQQVLLALKTKITSQEVMFNPTVVKKLYEAFDSATDTDLNIGELLTIGKLFVKTPQENISRVSLEDQLYNPPNSWYGRFVLLPKESFEALHAYVKQQLK